MVIQYPKCSTRKRLRYKSQTFEISLEILLCAKFFKISQIFHSGGNVDCCNMSILNSVVYLCACYTCDVQSSHYKKKYKYNMRLENNVFFIIINL